MPGHYPGDLECVHGAHRQVQRVRNLLAALQGEPGGAGTGSQPVGPRDKAGA